MLKITDPFATKELDVSGTQVIIKPLTPNERLRASKVMHSIKAGIPGLADISKLKGAEKKAAEQALGEQIALTVDRDMLASLLAPAVISIDRTAIIECADYTEETRKWAKDATVLEILEVMDTEDFWKIANEVLSYAGMTGDERKNLDSSSEQDTPKIKGGAGTSKTELTNVKPASETVSVTKRKSKSTRKAAGRS